MKTKQLFMIVVMTLLFPFVVTAQTDSKNPFESVYGMEDVDYAYISSAMLRSLKNNSIDVVGNAMINPKDLNMLVKIKGPYPSSSFEKIQSIVEKLVKDKKLDTLFSQITSKNKERAITYGKLSENGKEKETNILLIVKESSNGFSITYMTGAINLRILEF